MKKKIVVFVVCIVLLIVFINKNNSNKNENINNFAKELYELSNVADDFIEKNKIYNNLSRELEEVSSSLKRDEYNLVIEEINKVEYLDVKTKLLEQSEQVENEIIAKETLLYSAKETINGSVTAYTAYCSDGCHGYTASGRYVGGGNIYYEDPEYGTVRIVAGDRSYPFGTIVRFNNLKYFNEDVYAIVLDRGGAVGKNRKVLFDLLFADDGSANQFGIARGVDCDILRIGY